VGASLWLGRDRGLDPAGVRWGGWLDLTAETGTFSFVRPGVTLRGGVPLPGRLLAAAELGAGTTLGAAGETGFAAPVQSHWFLGGPTTLRGFAPGTFSGPDHLRGRAELATRLPAARLVVFSDAGWAGSFDHYHGRDVAVSAGAGASLLDGLLRFDVAGALRPITQWRLEMYVDALF
jgi:outer membrane protein assembly factor BamA